jgi:hypothetical protein
MYTLIVRSEELEVRSLQLIVNSEQLIVNSYESWCEFGIVGGDGVACVWNG